VRRDHDDAGLGEGAGERGEAVGRAQEAVLQPDHPERVTVCGPPAGRGEIEHEGILTP
jgi:hypothetical protein